jgi:hypothetical protein
MQVPVKQIMRARADLLVSVKELRAPFKMVVPVHTQVPIRQKLHVTGEVKVPINQTIPIHIKQAIAAALKSDLPVLIKLDNKLHISIKTPLIAEVKINDKVPVKLGTIQIRTDTVGVAIQ